MSYQEAHRKPNWEAQLECQEAEKDQELVMAANWEVRVGQTQVEAELVVGTDILNKLVN